MSTIITHPQPKLQIPWRTRLVISLISAVSDSARRSDGTLNRRLLNFLDMKSAASPHKPINSVLSSDITIDPSRNLWFRLYTPVSSSAAAPSSCCGGGPAAEPAPEEKKSLPVLIFFHGGGFCYLSAATKVYDIVCRRFCRRLSAVVVSVDYRLTPEHRFPAQYDDGIDVLKYLDENHAALLPPAADLSKCFLAGDSAGANLAHHVAVRACRASLRVVKVIGLVSIQPYFGGEERTPAELRLTGVPLLSVPRTDWAWKSFLPIGSDRDHYAVNVCGPNAEDISGLDYPDTVVFVGGFDPLRDWQIRYFEWLKKSGKEATLFDYPNMFHAFYIFPELSESGQLFRQVQDFVAKRLAKL